MKKTTPRSRMVIANWKMNPSRGTDAIRLTRAIVKKNPRPSCSVVIAPPAIHIDAVRGALSKRYTLGAQNMSERDGGAVTGEISGRMLYAHGVRCVIVGHSERRALGETDIQVNTKVRMALSLALTPVVCVGETVRDHHGKYFEVVEAQLRTALKNVKRTEIGRVVIAYEPVWAISSGDGKGHTATSRDAHEMKLFIQKVLVELYGRTLAMRVHILYGGSVNEGNASELMKEGEVDGFLVGGASLQPDAFTVIIKAASQPTVF